jgi:hypothetical protein
MKTTIPTAAQNELVKQFVLLFDCVIDEV